MTTQTQLEELRAKVRLAMLKHSHLLREQLPQSGPYEPGALNTGLPVIVNGRNGNAIVKVTPNGPCAVVAYSDDSLPRADQIHCASFEPGPPGVIALKRLSGDAPVALDTQGTTEADLLFAMLQIAEQAT